MRGVPGRAFSSSVGCVDTFDPKRVEGPNAANLDGSVSQDERGSERRDPAEGGQRAADPGPPVIRRRGSVCPGGGAREAPAGEPAAEAGDQGEEGGRELGGEGGGGGGGATCGEGEQEDGAAAAIAFRERGEVCGEQHCALGEGAGEREQQEAGIAGGAGEAAQGECQQRGRQQVEHGARERQQMTASEKSASKERSREERDGGDHRERKEGERISRELYRRPAELRRHRRDERREEDQVEQRGERTGQIHEDPQGNGLQRRCTRYIS